MRLVALWPLLILAAIQAASNAAAAFFSHAPAHAIQILVIFTAVHFLADLPFLFVVFRADRASRAWRARSRVPFLMLAVAIGAALYTVVYAVALEGSVVFEKFGSPDIWTTTRRTVVNLGTFWVRAVL